MMIGHMRNEIRRCLHHGHTISLKELHQVLIEEVLLKNQGNKTKSAIELGISVRTLRNKVNRHGKKEKAKNI